MLLFRMECRHQNQLAVPLACYSVAALRLDNLLAVFGGLVVLTVAVALPLAVAQTADRRQEV